ncbi:MAG: hypothetical protein ACLVB5_01115 [Christensenellales bacterium]
MLMVTVEFFAYKPPPAYAEHPLMVPPLMVTVEFFRIQTAALARRTFADCAAFHDKS